MDMAFEQVSKRFGDVEALRDISFGIESGELFFLLGPSGCGKTTLLRAIAGLETIDSGRILFDAKDVSRLPPHRRNTAMVFQGYALWPHMTVEQNVAFGLDVRGLSKSERTTRVREALAQVQITDLAQRKPNELSGGQQQRVALARTLVVKPSCVLLDEPLANLDAKLRRDMRMEIRSICKNAGLTAVYVTHDRQEALSMADRLAVLNHGRVLQIGSPRDIYSRPRSRFVAGFIGEANFIPGTVASGAGSGTTVETAAGRLRAAEAPADAKPGDEVTVCLRPEVLQIARNGSAPTDASAIQARLHTSTYLGELAEHEVVAGNDLKLRVFELNPRQDLSPDTTLSLVVAPEDVVLLTQ